MLKRLKTIYIASILSVFSAGSANAAMTTWTFTGTLDHDSSQVVTGWLSFDPLVTNGYLITESNQQSGMSFFGPPPELPKVTGYAHFGSFDVFVGGGLGGDQSFTQVTKNYYGSTGYNILGRSYDDQGNFSSYIQLVTSGTLGIFTALTPTLALDQPINWFAPGATPFGYLYGNGVAEGFNLTSVTVSAVPEPDSAVLIALGLAGLGLLRRRKS